MFLKYRPTAKHPPETAEPTGNPFSQMHPSPSAKPSTYRRGEVVGRPGCDCITNLDVVCGLQLNDRGRENELVVHQDREMPWLNAYCVPGLVLFWMPGPLDPCSLMKSNA